MGPPRFHIITLGCPKNEVDSDLITTGLLEEGFRGARSWEEADIIIVNTCSFIREAVEESLEIVLDLASLKKAGSKLLVTGCLYQRYGDRLRNLLPEVDGFFRSEELSLLFSQSRAGHAGTEGGGGKVGRWDGERLPAVSETPGVDRPVGGWGERRVFSGLDRGYVFLKISEGCDRSCSFCAIPSIKGRMRSRLPEELVKEAKMALSGGARELVLVSQDTTSYGKDLGLRDGLAKLLDMLAGIPGDFWLRLMYLQPDGLSETLLEMLGHPKICSYLDVPFQHVHPRILRLMGRRGSAAEFRELVQRLRERLDGVAIRTTFITGFPGEDRRAFRELLGFLEEIRPDWLSVFPFSPEEGTPAAGLLPGCKKGTAERRAEEMREVQEEIMRQKAESLQGVLLKVLVEGPSEMAPGFHEGRSYREAPEVDGLVFIADEEPLPCPSFIEARIADSDGIDLVGRMEMKRDGG